MNFIVAVLIPAFNESAAIEQVVQEFQAMLPEAAIYVYDNNSTDGTGRIAQRAGAILRHECLQGKGHVVRRMFADIDADAYLLVDGDGTYDAAAAPAMVALLRHCGLDMVTGVRFDAADNAYRPMHRFGNHALTGLVQSLFGNRVSDMLSGYRLFSRRFVKSFPVQTAGFEIETEFTVHALNLGMPIDEIPVTYRPRPAGGESKLNTWRDGLRILLTVLQLTKDEKPLSFFGLAGLWLALAGLALGTPLVIEFTRTGLVPRLPTAVLATGLELLAALSWLGALLLDCVSRGRKEAKRLAYLQIPGPAAAHEPAGWQNFHGELSDPRGARAWISAGAPGDKARSRAGFS